MIGKGLLLLVRSGTGTRFVVIPRAAEVAKPSADVNRSPVSERAPPAV